MWVPAFFDPDTKIFLELFFVSLHLTSFPSFERKDLFFKFAQVKIARSFNGIKLLWTFFFLQKDLKGVFFHWENKGKSKASISTEEQHGLQQLYGATKLTIYNIQKLFQGFPEITLRHALTHSFPMYPFSTLRFSDVLGGTGSVHWERMG